jgi:hypothetical protein
MVTGWLVPAAVDDPTWWKQAPSGDALGLFRFMINFPTWFTISKAPASCGARLGYLILHFRPLILGMSTPWWRGFF